MDFKNIEKPKYIDLPEWLSAAIIKHCKVFDKKYYDVLLDSVKLGFPEVERITRQRRGQMRSRDKWMIERGIRMKR